MRALAGFWLGGCVTLLRKMGLEDVRKDAHVFATSGMSQQEATAWANEQRNPRDHSEYFGSVPR
jgi:hypothetical protein